MLGQVDVHGGAGDHQVIVGQRRRDDGTVVLLLAQAQHEPLPDRLFGHGDEQLVVGVNLPRPKHDERQAGGLEHLAHRCAGVLRRVGIAVGVRQAESEQDQVGAGFLSRLGPLAGVLHRVAPGLHQQG